MGFRIDWCDQRLRSVAYDILCRRDRIFGWKPSRDALLASIRLDRASLTKEVHSRLQKILTHAYDSCLYYRQLWDEIGFRPSTSLRAEDLFDLPFLTKEIIREKKSMMVSDRFDGDDLDLSYTGGTTGTQTSFYLDHACKVARVGRQWGVLELCGYRPGMRRGLVWGVHDDLPIPGLRGSFKRWFRRYASSQETFCCTVMHERMMMDFYARLSRLKPEVLYGYPSALVQLARFIEGRRLEPVRVKATITTAERLGPVHRRQLAEMFGGEVFSLYATREYGCIGFECEMHQGLHIDAGSVLMEIVNDGRRVAPGESGEIVITDLLNYGMPFIRSRTGDMGVLSPQPCECGSPLPVLRQLEGRLSDLVYRPDGSVVPGLMLSDLFKDLPSIRFQQFVQESVNQLDVLLVVTGEFSEPLRAEVLRQVREIMGDEIAVQIRLVDDIERNPRSGKIQEVISRIDRPQALHSAET